MQIYFRNIAESGGGIQPQATIRIFLSASLHMTLLWIILTTLFICPVWLWRHHSKPKFTVQIKDTDDGVQIFHGRNNNVIDHFQIIHINREYFIVGARNTMYNISLNTLKESQNHRITWPPTKRNYSICRGKQKSQDECQNYIRMVNTKVDGSMQMCGTNAFNPICRSFINISTHNKGLYDEHDGKGLSPFEPEMTSVFTFADGQIYAATAVDFLKSNFMIRREDRLHTNHKDSLLFNQPNFIKSFSYGDKVYFFFRESAIENINCKKVIFSRVSRVCKSDRGGSVILSGEFTSFFKSRLNCSVPGEFPFYFDELQSVSDLGNGNYMSTSHSRNRTDMVYAVFTTPPNSITGSAICAFNMRDIIESYQGKFKGQENSSPTSQWLPVPDSEVPVPRPNECSDNSQALQGSVHNFIKMHPLMDSAVPASGGQPLLIITDANYRFTAVAVDWMVMSADNRYYDVIFTGTDHGHVLKSINKGQDGKIVPLLIEDVTVFSDGRPITSLYLHRESESGIEKLIVTSKNAVISIPLHRCHLSKTCSDCVALQDPYCSWTREGKCSNVNTGFQDLKRNGTHSMCNDQEETTKTVKTTQSTCAPCLCSKNKSVTSGFIPAAVRRPVEIKKSKKIINKENGVGTSKLAETSSVLSSETLAISLVVAIILSLISGFLIGYRVSICRHPAQPQREATFLDKAELHKVCDKYDSTDGSKQFTHNSSNVNVQPKPLNVVLNIQGSKNPTHKKHHHGSHGKVYL